MFLEAAMTPALDLSPENLENIFRLVLTAIFVFALVAAHFFLPDKWRNGITVCTGIFTLIGSLFIYSYGYLQLCSSFVAAVTRTLLSTIQAFLGADDWGDMKDVLKSGTEQTVFWVIHITALITSSGAIAMAIRKVFIRTIRKWGLRSKNIELIYGLTENTLAFGEELLEKGDAAVVYVAEDPNTTLADAAWDMGAVVFSSAAAVEASTSFAFSLKLQKHNKKIRLYAISPNYISNYKYAAKLQDTLQQLAVLPDRISLTLIGSSDDAAEPLLAVAKPGRDESLAVPVKKLFRQKRFEENCRQYIAETYAPYGFGSVNCVDEPNMVGRLLVQTYPPYQVMEFDRDGKAKYDFHGLIIGFGQVGQAVLRHVVMNSQFQGSTFHLAVFDPQCQQSSGRLLHECSAMFRDYKILLEPHDGRSNRLYQYLSDHSDSLNYIVVCTGSNAINEEIADQIRVYLHRNGSNAAIYLCGHRGVIRHSDVDCLKPHSIYTTKLLQTDVLDRKAKYLHHRYKCSKGSTLSIDEHWRDCDYFSRNSNRASADFQPAFLAMAHTTREEAIQNWKPTGALRDSLAITEHLRWNAFHYCMGFRPLTDEEFEQRKATYAEDIKANPDYRIGKDMARRIHGCIRSWEELKKYNLKENEVTGSDTDYQFYDYENIEAIGTILADEQAFLEGQQKQPAKV